MLDSYINGFMKDLFDFCRKGAGGNIYIIDFFFQQSISDASAYKISFKTCFFNFFNYRQSFFKSVVELYHNKFSNP
ncbi:Uncharacterised protein [Mycobacteroides abscessus subsp. abscessus]|nr:Uncharacterised protein [Mycobacteroides abscessus subsp. abscessus]